MFRVTCPKTSGICSFAVLRSPSPCHCRILLWVCMQGVPCLHHLCFLHTEREALSGLGRIPLLRSYNSSPDGKNSSSPCPPMYAMLAQWLLCAAVSPISVSSATFLGSRTLGCIGQCNLQLPDAARLCRDVLMYLVWKVSH